MAYQVNQETESVYFCQHMVINKSQQIADYSELLYGFFLSFSTLDILF